MQARAPEPREGTPSPRLDEREFLARFLSQFPDPAFDTLRDELARVAAAAWDAYDNQRKSPRTRKAGPEFADSDYRPGRGLGRRARGDPGSAGPARRPRRAAAHAVDQLLLAQRTHVPQRDVQVVPIDRDCPRGLRARGADRAPGATSKRSKISVGGGVLWRTLLLKVICNAHR
jgi:hypothetical protein